MTVLGKGALVLASKDLVGVEHHAVQVVLCLHVDHRDSVAEEEVPDHGSAPKGDSTREPLELVEQDREEVAEVVEHPTVVLRVH